MQNQQNGKQSFSNMKMCEVPDSITSKVRVALMPGKG